ncbi:S-adenosyl-L-methionine-dependent methyltransferase, partial [Tricladium varicosporioides]
SPFFYPSSVAKNDGLSIIHLKRDLQNPTILQDHDPDDGGYSEGKVVNTRFGSFPHTTLIGMPWGSQVRASVVDTGSRGRRKNQEEKKRKRQEVDAKEHAKKIRKLEDGIDEGADASTPASSKEDKAATAAPTGFIHILPPTPENWTSSLPHRTQVVYTPDYSYILHRLRARPGSSLIEAGAGSGSFTHASARAVFSGFPSQVEEVNGSAPKRRKIGKVWSFEFHEQRHAILKEELRQHGMEEIVQITHRDVCEEGFLVGSQSPNVNAIFLDLPAPWLALPHLSRSRPPLLDKRPSAPATPAHTNGVDQVSGPSKEPWISPLNPSTPVHICTFSPCIEQVQRTISIMRKLGWVDIETVELAHKRVEVRRERIGIQNGTERGLLNAPANVQESLSRLMEIEGNFKAFHENGEKVVTKKKNKGNPNNREKIIESLVDNKVYKEGNLVHKSEPEVKTHTSYLVFAVLPIEWTEEDEAKARALWDVKIRVEDDSQVEEKKKIPKPVSPDSKRQVKKAAR